MENNNILNDVFYLYPKSTNHSIVITKKDKIGICDLKLNCTKLNFSINKNKENIFNDSNNKIDNFICVGQNNLQNYDIIILFLVITLFIVLRFHLKK